MTVRGVAGLPERLRNAFSGRVDLLESASVSDLPLSVPTQFMDAIMPATQRAFELAAVSSDELTRVVTYWNNMKNRRNAERESQGQPLATGNTSLLSLREDMTPPALPSNIPASPLAVTLEMPATLPEDSSARLPIIPDRAVASARALAAYLGWLSVGALRDILGQSDSEARETLQILRKLGILEESDGPIWRFVRLGEPPEDSL
jgi:DNA-binding transcriptional ArsR family regulator